MILSRLAGINSGDYLESHDGLSNVKYGTNVRYGRVAIYLPQIVWAAAFGHERTSAIKLSAVLHAFEKAIGDYSRLSVENLLFAQMVAPIP